MNSIIKNQNLYYFYYKLKPITMQFLKKTSTQINFNDSRYVV